MRRIETVYPDGASAVGAVYEVVIACVNAGMKFIWPRRFFENHDIARHESGSGHGSSRSGLFRRSAWNLDAVLRVRPVDQTGTVEASLRRTAAGAIRFTDLRYRRISHP